MHRYPGLGDRIRARLLALGFAKGGRADTQRFCQERGYRPQYVYAWLKDRVPTYQNLERLARDLDVSMAWLTFGQDIPETERQAIAVTAPSGRRSSPRREPLFRASVRGRTAGRPVRPGAALPPSPVDEGSHSAPGQLIDFRRLREATDRLARLEAELDALFRAFPDLHVWLGPDGTILSCKVGRGADFRLPAGALEGQSVFDLVPPEVADQLRKAYAAAVPGEVHALEYTLPSPDGPRYREVRFLTLGPERRRTIFAIVRDMTARRQAEEAARALGRVGQDLVGPVDLQEVAERIASTVLTLFRVERAGVWRLDPNGTTVTCLAAAGGPTPEAWVGRRFACQGLLSGLAITWGRPTWTDDLLADARVEHNDELRRLVETQGIRSGISVPLVVRGRALGTLFVGGDPPGRAFSENDVGLLAAFADQAALALEHARLLGELDARRRTAESLAEVGRLLSQSREPGEVSRRIVESVMTLFGARSAILFRLDAESGDLTSVAVAGEPHPTQGRQVVLPRGQGVAGVAVQRREPFVVGDYLSDPRLSISQAERALFASAPNLAIMAVPLVAGDVVVGALSIIDATGRQFTDEEVAASRLFAEQAAFSLRHADLLQAARPGSP